MRKTLSHFIILLCFLPVEVLAQTFTITGTVKDSVTGLPVAAASVFLSNTSIGTTVGSTGQFTLSRVPQGRFDLIVSSIGYQTYVVSITPDKPGKPMQINLLPKANELAGVVVGTYDKDGWSKWGKLFTDNVIGTWHLAGECVFKNYKAIKFRYSKKRDVLQAFADEPLVFENNALGYKLTYKLESFSFNFTEHTLQYMGFPLFEEMDGSKQKQEKWKARRKEVYYGSVMHFMRCLYANKLEENGYVLRRLEKIPNKEQQRIKALYKYYINPDHSQDEFEQSLPKDTLQYYERILDQPAEKQILHNEPLVGDSVIYVEDSVTVAFSFSNYLYITYKSKKEPLEYLEQTFSQASPGGFITSQVTLQGNKTVYVLYNGVYYQPQDLFTTGYWAWSEKISSLLPIDYWP